MRDYRIEILRFLATIGIAIFHFEWIYIGHPVYLQHFYLFVEFFFVLSGFFLAKNVKKYSVEDNWAPLRYVSKEIGKLWSPYIVAFIFSLFVYCKVNGIDDIESIVNIIWRSKWEAIFLQLSGIDPTAPVINGVTAYIPAMLVSSLLIVYLYQHHYKITVNIFCVIIPIFIYSHIVNNYGNLSQWMAYEKWTTVGILRGFAGMLIGVFISEKGERLFGGGRKLGQICLPISTVAVICLVLCKENISYNDELIYPYIFSIQIASIYYFKSKVSVKDFIKRVSLYLGGISYYIFLMHYGICYLFKLYYKDESYGCSVCVYLILVILVGCMLNYAMLYHNRSKSKSI